MTDNTSVNVNLFGADMTHALVRRGERLLASTDLAGDVAALEPLEAYYIVKEIGLDQALPILLELSPEQLEACVDIDCWNRFNFAVDTLDEWLTAFSRAGGETLAISFFSLDYVVQLLFLAQTVTVYDPDTDQVPPIDEEDARDRAMTPDGFYLLELKSDIELKIHPFSLLDAMYMYDSAATHRLMSEVRVDLATQIEEEALRFRNGRMEDIGFATPDEAVTLFSRPNSRKPSPRPPKSQSGPDRQNQEVYIPAVYAEPLNETTLLQQALSLVTDQGALARLEQEIVWVINSAMIAYGEKSQGSKQLSDIAERVRDTVSLGLEVLLVQEESDCLLDGAGAATRACQLLEAWPVADLFRHGFAVALELQKRARQALLSPRFSAWYELPEIEQSDESDDRLGRAFVCALLGRHPLCGGFAQAKSDDIKAFASLADIDEARVRLKQLVAQICAPS